MKGYDFTGSSGSQGPPPDLSQIEQVSGRMPEDVPDRLPEYLSDRVPEDMPDILSEFTKPRKCAKVSTECKKICNIDC